jgi:vacuolar-type H+-ATPase subunit H
MCYHWLMGQLLVRNVPDDLVKALKERATKHGRSAEAEHRAILEENLKAPAADFWEKARRYREETRGRIISDSAELIRQDRDSR